MTLAQYIAKVYIMIGVKRMEKLIKSNILPLIHISNILAYCHYNEIRHNNIAKDLRDNIDEM